MKHRARRADAVGIEIAPLIDIVFILLIFFVVTSTFIHEAALELELPSATSAEEGRVTDAIEITISAANEINVAGVAVAAATVEAVRTQLMNHSGGSIERALVVRADAKANHETVVVALDAASVLGFTKVNIVTVRSDG